ncbi:MAG TPA: hypothetical protein VH619_01765 [Verrucomicrobiae bacterium]|jgi:hypothetical protein|nr:hypothetical protein [Verrucomicrobiae bacterium]
MKLRASSIATAAILLWVNQFNAMAGDPATVFGVAHADGKYYLTTQDYLDEGADQILATGSKVIKLYLAPQRYPWNSDWPKDLHSLVQVAQTPYFKSVFSKPFTTYILTAFSLGREDHYWTTGITADQAADETQQFHDLTKYLLTTYKGTGKTFVLQHWEGDWALRHGSPKPYDANYVPSGTVVKGMIEWLNARQAGIVKARTEIGQTDVHVYGAAEANRLEDSMAGKSGVANSVLPYTTVDLASYSSYNFLDTPERLSKAVDYLAAHLPPTAVFGRNPHSVYLGEFGYPENGREGVEGLNRRMDSAEAVVKSKGLPWAVFWEIYCNEPLDKSLPLPLNGKENDRNLRGFWMVKPDGTPAMAWHRYRRLFITADANRATTTAIKSGLSEVFRDDFNRPDSGDLGPGWTQAAHYGVVNKRVMNHRLQFTVPDGHDIPWGSATLDLKSRAIRGEGLEVGDYFEIRLRRLSEQGGLGVELFDSDQLRVGSDLKAGPSMLKAWNGTTWAPIAFDDHGLPVQFDWNAVHTLGVRFDSADGYRTSFSYYLDGQYAGSWLIATPGRPWIKLEFTCNPAREARTSSSMM